MHEKERAKNARKLHKDVFGVDYDKEDDHHD